MSEIAVIIAISKDKYEEQISSILEEIGVFVYKDNKEDLLKFCKDIDTDSFKNIYYKVSELIADDIKFMDGSCLDYNQKYYFFHICFEGIKVNKANRPIASYPIGQFIFQIYKILTDGITAESFKKLLYSNWDYYNKTTNT